MLDTVVAEAESFLRSHAATMVSDPPATTGTLTGSLLASSTPLNEPYASWSKGLEWSLNETQAFSRALARYSSATVVCPPDVSSRYCRPTKLNPGVRKTWPMLAAYISGCMVSGVNDWEAFVRNGLDAETSFQLARYLWNGIAGAGAGAYTTQSASFVNSVDLVDSTARTPVRVLSSLTQAMRDDGYHGKLWFHVNDAALPRLHTYGLVSAVGATYRVGDHVVVVDPGYQRALGTNAAAAGTAWMVVSGRVETAVGPIGVIPPTDATCADPTWEAQRLGFVRFEGTPGVGKAKAALLSLWDA